jgi:hypothetical protein
MLIVIIYIKQVNVQREAKKFTQTTRQVFEILTVTSHPHRKALLQPTILATIAVVFSHLAVLATTTLIPQLLAD